MSDASLKSAARELFGPSRGEIVIVDDDAALLRALRFDLEIEGFSVQTHTSPTTLHTSTLPRTDGCLIIDYRLPGMTGLDLLRRMRANHIALPAIIITTNPRPSLQARAAALHAIVVEKPLLGDALITAVDEALDAAKRKMPR